MLLKAAYFHLVGHGPRDPILLGQVVDNLIDNALEYSPPGTPVRVWVEPSPADAVIGVQDEGPGIPAADLGRVFDPFFRSDDARRQATASRTASGFGKNSDGMGVLGAEGATPGSVAPKAIEGRRMDRPERRRHRLGFVGIGR